MMINYPKFYKHFSGIIDKFTNHASIGQKVIV